MSVNLTAAIRAAMQDQFDRRGSTHLDHVAPIICAAFPIIEQAVRAQVTTEIEAEEERRALPRGARFDNPDRGHHKAGWHAGMETASRIARGGVVEPPPFHPDPALIGNVEGNRKQRDRDRASAIAHNRAHGLTDRPQ